MSEKLSKFTPNLFLLLLISTLTCLFSEFIFSRCFSSESKQTKEQATNHKMFKTASPELAHSNCSAGFVFVCVCVFCVCVYWKIFQADAAGKLKAVFPQIQCLSREHGKTNNSLNVINSYHDMFDKVPECFSDQSWVTGPRSPRKMRKRGFSQVLVPIWSKKKKKKRGDFKPKTLLTTAMIHQKWKKCWFIATQTWVKKTSRGFSTELRISVVICHLCSTIKT